MEPLAGTIDGGVTSYMREEPCVGQAMSAVIAVAFIYGHFCSEPPECVFLLSLLLPGPQVIVYLVLWLLMPRRPY